MNLRVPINSTGYGRVGTNLFRSLIKNDLKLKLIPIGQPQINNEDLKREIIVNNVETPCSNATLSVWHEFDAWTRIGKGRHYFYPFFEKSVLDKKTITSLNQQDEIIVSSQWAKDVLEKSGLNLPIHVIPAGVDTKLFHPIDVLENDSTFRILNVGKWEIRKGHDVIIDIFNKAFSKEDDVELLMSCTNPFISEEDHKKWQDLYLNSPLGEKIKFLGFVPDDNLRDLYNYVDIGLFPTRSEGFGLPILEMQSCGKPVIVTNYSAPTEFCTEENSFLVDIDQMEPAYDGRWFFGDTEWASYGTKQIDQCVEYLRDAYNNRPINPAGVETANNMTWDIMAQKIKSITDLQYLLD